MPLIFVFLALTPTDHHRYLFNFDMNTEILTCRCIVVLSLSDIERGDMATATICWYCLMWKKLL